MDSRFHGNRYVVVGEDLLRARCAVRDDGGRPVLFVNWSKGYQKGEYHLCADESYTTSLVSITRRPAAFTAFAAYDVMDSVAGQKVGAVKHLGGMGATRFRLWDTEDKEIGLVREDNLLLGAVHGLLRTWSMTYLFPRSCHAEIGGTLACRYSFRSSQRGSVEVEFADAPPDLLDKRLGVVVGVMLWVLG